MLSLNLLRKKIETIANRLKTRGFELNVSRFNELETERKFIQTKIEALQANRNQLAKKIGHLKKSGENANSIIIESQDIPNQIKNLKSKMQICKRLIEDILVSLPNLPDHTVPIGSSSDHNVSIRSWNPVKSSRNDQTYSQFSLDLKDHATLGQAIGLDCSLGAFMSGSRFCFLRGDIARLHRALAQFMLDVQIDEHGYIECYTPFIVNAQMLFGTGQLPKFKNDMFSVRKDHQISSQKNQDENNEWKDDEQYLISTSEITLTNTVKDSIIPVKDLPIKLIAHSPCFRAEAGSAGKDTRGLIRLHQFDKVEIVSIVRPETSYKVLEDMVRHVEYLLQILEIPYRVTLLCTGDMGFCSAKTYDIEAWFPGQNSWIEISSISNCESFQARRMKARFRDEDGKIDYLHTLNGSSLAVGRSLAAILENYQRPNGSIIIPKVLRSYMKDQEIINPK